MEFLVEIRVSLPPSLDATDLLAREQVRGRELKAQGHIVRMWRIPGRLANVGIWSARDATELHSLITSLPMFPYLDAQVTPLAVHYLEEGERRDDADA